MDDLHVWLAVALLSAALACLVLVARPWRWGGGAASARRGRRARGRWDPAVGVDALTGVSDRAGLEERLDLLIAEADGMPATGVAVVYLGLDEFDRVNEAYGHQQAESMLRETARRLRDVVGLQPLGRIAGADFVLACPGGPHEGRRLAAEALEAIARPFVLGERPAQLRASAGLALYPEHGGRPRLVARAMTAMHVARGGGGGAFCEYVARMESDLRERTELAADLRLALGRGELSLVYQPKIDARTLQITAAEALLRWNHPRRGLVSPAVFVPIAERAGLIGSIGDWVVDEATRQAAAWRDQGLRMRVAINVSGTQMRRDDFVDRLAKALARHRLSPGRFTCEITEGVAMEDTEATRQAFERLRRLGVHVSIDDFGTGHSSLAWLRRLPAEELKIDRAFLTDLDTDPNADAIIRAIVQMAHALGLRVVAEGVETPAQSERLVQLGCDELQGFLFARPMSAVALGLWARDGGEGAPLGFRASLFAATQHAPAD